MTKPDESLDLHDLEELVEMVEISLDEPPTKKRSTWCQYILQEEEKHGAPSSTFRDRRRPEIYLGYVAYMSHINDSKPTTFEEDTKQHVCKYSMVENYKSIMKNDVWEVVPKLEHKSIVTSKWIYKIKHVVDGNIEKYKARFVACGFSPKEGIDNDETFNPVAKYTIIQFMIPLTLVFGWKLHQMDVQLPFSMVKSRKKYTYNNLMGL